MNAEGYPAPTADEAIKRADKGESCAIFGGGKENRMSKNYDDTENYCKYGGK